MKTIEKIIGSNIRERRKALKLSQKELGKAAGLTVQSLGKIESGKRQARSGNLEEIAKALKCKREDLLHDPHVESQPSEIPDIIEFLKLWQRASKTRRESAKAILRGGSDEEAKSKSQA